MLEFLGCSASVPPVLTPKLGGLCFFLAFLATFAYLMIFRNEKQRKRDNCEESENVSNVKKPKQVKQLSNHEKGKNVLPENYKPPSQNGQWFNGYISEAKMMAQMSGVWKGEHLDLSHASRPVTQFLAHFGLEARPKRLGLRRPRSWRGLLKSPRRRRLHWRGRAQKIQ